MPAQREWFDTDFYKVLGVTQESTDKEITRAYRKLAKQYHPDANPGAEEKFKEISAAYDVLGDADKRKEYDEVRRLGPPGGFAGGDYNFNVGDLGDLFGGIFNNQGTTSRRRRGQAATPSRGSDIEAQLRLSFTEAVEGVVTSVSVPSHVTCGTCGGSGSKPGTMPVVCARCGGSGVLNDNQGLFSLSSPCPECRGRGTKIIDPCPTCFGVGMERRDRQVKVRIPAGVNDGQRIRVKGRGESGRNGGPAGDMFVNVRVEGHPIFGRRSNDLTITVPITFAEAALGATITVPSLENPVSLKIPAGTRSGRTLRVRGYGLRHGKDRGDLLVTVEVNVPTELSEAQRKAVEELAKATTTSPREHLEA